MSQLDKVKSLLRDMEAGKLPPLDAYPELRAKIIPSGEEYWMGVMFHDGNPFHRFVGCHGRHSWEEISISPRNVMLLKARKCVACDRIEAFGDWLNYPSSIGATEIILLIGTIAGANP